MLANILSYLKARPALVAAAFGIAGTFLASAGLHLSTAQLAVVVSMFNSALAALVHQATAPAGKHETGQREEHS